MAGQFTKGQALGPRLALGLQHRTVLVKRTKVTGEFVEVIAKKVRTALVDHLFQHKAKPQKMLGQRDLLRLAKRFLAREKQPPGGWGEAKKGTEKLRPAWPSECFDGLIYVFNLDFN